jgi:hypothetical protein
MAKNVVSFVWGFIEATFIFIVIMFPPNNAQSWTVLFLFPLIISTVFLVGTIVVWLSNHWDSK